MLPRLALELRRAGAQRALVDAGRITTGVPAARVDRRLTARSQTAAAGRVRTLNRAILAEGLDVVHEQDAADRQQQTQDEQKAFHERFQVLPRVAVVCKARTGRPGRTRGDHGVPVRYMLEPTHAQSCASVKISASCDPVCAVTSSTPSDTEPRAHRFAEGFAERLPPHFVLEQLEAHPASIFGLFPGGQIGYVNPALVRFARENGARDDALTSPWLGHRYLDAVAEPLKPFYTKLFELAARKDGVLQPVSHVYECSSATVFRQFGMNVYALARGAGLVVINTLVSLRPHDDQLRVPEPPDRVLYESDAGLIVQCAHCRLIRRADRSRWDWVPAWIEETPSGASHAVCEVCLEYYFPDG